MQTKRSIELTMKQWDLVMGLIENELDADRLELKNTTDADDYEFLQQAVQEMDDLEDTLSTQLRR